MRELLRDMQAIEIQIADNERLQILENLGAIPTSLDQNRGREISTEEFFYHSIQDALFAARIAKPDNRYIRTAQACFTKDLVICIGRFTPSDNSEMFELLNTVLTVGTSVYWDRDAEFIKSFYPRYRDIGKQVIRPWVYSSI